MKKFLKWFLIVVVVLGIGLFGAYKYMISETKKHSPEDTVNFNKGDLELTVFYNRPSKKGREIFGALVPYGKVWRTGANEATTFETNKDILINGQSLPKGKYSLFTIPGAKDWEVIFNSEMYQWGVKRGGIAAIDRKYDALIAKVPVAETTAVTELFTISFDDGSGALILAWDKTKIEIPISE